MVMLGTLRSLSVGAAVGSLAAGYALGGRPAWAALIACAGILWLLFLLRGSAPAGAVGLIGCAGVASAGLMLDLGPGWMLVGMLGALSAWDLAAFALWMQDCPASGGAKVLERQHLLRLLLADAIGLGLALVALQIRIQLRLGFVLLLGVALMIGLTRAVRYLRRLTG
jgi:hypothetical protein